MSGAYLHGVDDVSSSKRMPVTGCPGHYIAVGRARLSGPRVVTIRASGASLVTAQAWALQGRAASADLGPGPGEMAGAYIDIASVARPSLIVRTPSREHEGEWPVVSTSRVCCSLQQRENLTGK